MKKVMFMIVGMFFSLSVSAGSMVLTNTFDSSDDLPANPAVVSGLNTAVSIHADSGAFLTGSSIDDSWNMFVTDDVPGWNFGITSNQDASPFTATISDGSGVLATFNGITGDILFYYNFLTSGEFTLRVFGVASTTGQTSYDVDINEVPVPAALFLFAPALLGFFGLRRKAAIAA